MPYCNGCGVEYRLGAEVCSKCGVELPRVKDLKAPGDIGGAALGALGSRRVLAGLIDLAIAYGMFAYVLLLVSRRFPVARPLVMIFGAVIVLLIPNPYLVLKDAVEGKSIGKLITGLVAYNERQRRASGVMDSILRNWYLGVPLIGPTVLTVVIGLQVLAGRPNRLGDSAAHTRVIMDLDYQRVR